jgi:hypothetical protein
LGPGDVVKVKYGDTNGEVFAAVAASRLFWALGFGADAVYRVRVTCRNCPADPWKASVPPLPAVVFENATIERKLPGEEIAHEDGEGWGWDELDLVDPSEGGAPLEQREALTLLAVFVQHTDNKKVNQRLICLPEGQGKEGARPPAPRPSWWRTISARPSATGVCSARPRRAARTSGRGRRWLSGRARAAAGRTSAETSPSTPSRTR